jgi:hypothetical protein
MMNTNKVANAIASIGLVGVALLTSGPARATCGAWSVATTNTPYQPVYMTATCSSGAYYENAYFAGALGSGGSPDDSGATAVLSYGESSGARGYYVDTWLLCPHDSQNGGWHEYGVQGPYHTAGNNPPSVPPSQVLTCSNLGFQNPAQHVEADIYVW